MHGSSDFPNSRRSAGSLPPKQSLVEPRHERIAKIALLAAGSQGLALAGGYAVRAYGMGNRPSGDVDLFTDWAQRDNFPHVLAIVIAALEDNGYTVAITSEGESFARLEVSEGGQDSIPDKLELAADWRAHPPVLMGIGPVLHQLSK